jgi:hypothetical protein
MLKGPGGVPYVADSHGTKMMEVQCDCGHKWSMLHSDFPGRRQLKSCGRVQCPHSIPKPKRGHGSGMACTMYFTADNTEWLTAKSKTLDCAKSRIVNRLLDQARADELLND